MKAPAMPGSAQRRGLAPPAASRRDLIVGTSPLQEVLDYRTYVRCKQPMLTERQQAILDFINEYVDSNGFPPSVREIGRHFGIYPATVQDHISALERKGFLQKKRFQSRTISVPASSRPSASGIPIVGKVAAGQPVL